LSEGGHGTEDDDGCAERMTDKRCVHERPQLFTRESSHIRPARAKLQVG
jgi:hypothetical protein